MVTLGASLVQAQQQSQNPQTPDQQQQSPGQSAQPIPAYRSPLVSAADTGDFSAQEGTPDNRSLSGARNLSPYLESTRSYWQPQVNAYGILSSNPSGTGSGTNWTAGAAVSGSVDVHRVSGVSTLDVSYTGGGAFTPGYSTQSVQAMGFSDKISFHRSTLSFYDNLAYLPGSTFGYGGLGGLPGGTLPGSGSTGLNPVFGPGQTILTGLGQILQNSVVAEFDTNLSPRATLTLAGGFYFLHYFSGGFLNSTNPNARAGYNYALTAKDTIAVIYTYSRYDYGNARQAVNSHWAAFSYGRVVTQRISVQIGAGPQVAMSQIPISVSGTPTTLSSTTWVGWALNTGLTYTNGRNSVGVFYYHGLNPGSGVFAGSNSDTVSGSFRRAMSRTFSSGLSGGYSRNQGVTKSGAIFVNQSYSYWYGGATLSHPVGTSLGLTLSYWAAHQNNPTCVGTGCSYFTNLISFGVGWHARPMAF